MKHQLIVVLVLILAGAEYSLQQNTCLCKDLIKKRTDRLKESIEGATEQIQSDINQQQQANQILFDQHATNIADEVRRQLKPIIDQQATKIADEVRQQLRPIIDLFNSTPSLGTEYGNPASSCKAIRDANPDSASGYYWIHGGSGLCPVRMFCDMEKTCNGISGGWMKIADIDMRNSGQSCPSGLRLLTNTRRRCAKIGDSGGCGSTTFSVQGIKYGKVCGKIIGYQDKSTDAFKEYHYHHDLTIDSTYVDGVSLTRGQNPRQHIWTFASAYAESQKGKQNYGSCPCSYRYLSGYSDIPPFVGNDYFCDSGAEQANSRQLFTDPLWDGAGCGSASTCCSLNNPPWFMKTLPSTTNQDIEMRLCRNWPIDDEDVGVEQVELYVQ